MAPFEALYSRRRKTPVSWNDLEETPILGPEMIQEMINKIKVLQRNMKTAQDREKSYTYQR